MEVTRRYWFAVGLVCLLGLWALILERPLVLGGAILVAGWILTRQYRFVRISADEFRTMSVSQSLTRNRLTAGETITGTLAVETARPARNRITVQSGVPSSADASEIACELACGDQTDRRTVTAQWPIAGGYTFDPPTVTATDSLRLFRQSISTGPTPTVTVEPRAPRDIHIGEGGNPIAVGFGEHEAGDLGSGLTPAELRQYVPGDSTKRIDWKATARLQTPHVREFEAETNLETQLIVDHRASMSTGESGQTKLDFAREVALALVTNAEEYGDPLGWYSVGDEGITESVRPRAAPEQYRRIADRIRQLTPTAGPATAQTTSVSPADAKQMARVLTDDDVFNEKLGPFFRTTASYIQRIASEPLFETIQTASERLDGPVRTIVVTDDQCRTELREAVKLARRGSGNVVVFLCPTVLYELAAIRDLDDAYRRYREFESFRRDLAALRRVSAFELGPSDSIKTVLSAGQYGNRVDQ
jgi:uncharacterized protein (DUF58 family)